MPEQPYDKRLIKRRMRKGQLDQKTLKAHLETLEDLSDQCVAIEATVGPDLEEESTEEEAEA